MGLFTWYQAQICLTDQGFEIHDKNLLAARRVKKLYMITKIFIKENYVLLYTHPVWEAKQHGQKFEYDNFFKPSGEILCNFLQRTHSF